MDTRSRIGWGILFVGILAISHLLCRFVFFDLHGMKQWPNVLAVVALIVVIIATAAGGRIVAWSAIVGYSGGFIISMTFNSDGVDPGGGGTNNAWIIWTLALLVSILVGVVVTVASSVRHARKSR